MDHTDFWNPKLMDNIKAHFFHKIYLNPFYEIESMYSFSIVSVIEMEFFLKQGHGVSIVIKDVF